MQVSSRAWILAVALVAVGAILVVAWNLLGEGRVAPTSIAGEMSASPIDHRDPEPSQLVAPSTTERAVDPTPSAALAASPKTVSLESPKAAHARMRAQMEALAVEEDWASTYATLAAPQLQAERDALESKIVSLTSEHLETKFARGEFVFTGNAGARTEDVVNPFEIRWIRSGPGEPEKIAIASEETCGEAYRLRSRSVWLSERAAALQGQVPMYLSK